MKIGIIGCGGIAHAHARAYLKNQAEVTAITDVKAEAARAFLSRVADAKIYPSYKELIADGNVTAVSICTPPGFHEESAVFALEHNVHVLCEKPLSLNMPSAKRMLKAAKKSKALLMTAFRHRFLPSTQKMRETLDRGVIGDVVLFSNVFSGPAFAMKDKWFSKKAIAGGGTLIDTSIHSVDIFRYLFGEIADAKAVMHRHMKEIDVEDASALLLQSKKGVLGSLLASWVVGDGQAFIDIVGQAGHLVFDYYKSDKVLLKEREKKDWEEIPVVKSDGFAEEVAHFIGAVKGSHALSCTGEDGLRALEVIEAIYEKDLS